jgi:hypothetical protein
MRMRWVGHVVSILWKKNKYTILVRGTERKRRFSDLGVDGRKILK